MCVCGALLKVIVSRQRSWMDSCASLSADGHTCYVCHLHAEGEERDTVEREKQNTEEKRIWKWYCRCNKEIDEEKGS